MGISPRMRNALFLWNDDDHRGINDLLLIVAVIENNQVKAAAGYRITEYLAWGKKFYLDGLITEETVRRKGYVKMLWQCCILSERTAVIRIKKL